MSPEISYGIFPETFRKLALLLRNNSEEKFGTFLADNFIENVPATPGHMLGVWN